MTHYGDSTPATRIHWIEWIRALGAPAVVLLHTLHVVLTNTPLSELGTSRASAYVLLEPSLTRWAVPVFLMVSGALLLNPEKELPWPKLRKYLLRMVKVALAFGFTFCLFEVGFNRSEFSLSVIAEAARNTLYGWSWSHMWYIYALIGLYLMTPILRPFVATAPRQTQRNVLITIFALNLCIPFINHFFSTHFLTFLTFTAPAFYYLLGHYAATYLTLNAPIAVTGVLSILAASALPVWSVFNRGTYGTEFFGNSSPFIAPYALLIFLAFRRFLDKPLPKPAAFMARYSFGVYLLHPVFLNILYKVATPLPLPAALFELTNFALSLVGALALTWVLAKLPFFRSVL